MRPALLTIGVLIALAAGAVALGGSGSFTVHMIAHMTMVAIAAPLLAVALSGTMDTGRNRLLPVSPVIASLVELVIVWFWHLPQMRALAESSLAAGLAEQCSFLFGGLLLWMACLSPGNRLAGVVGLLLTSMHMTLLGVLLAAAPRPLYGGTDVTCFGVPLNAEMDQQLGGVIMLLVGAVSYLVGGLALLHRVIAGPHSHERALR